jgi:N utilization substance protein A
MKGVRIQAIVRELEGEKIDILKYDNNPRDFIKNALSPAEVDTVVVLDEAKRQALAVVEENQLSLAIGKQGLNVRLANRLVDWNIDVKTVVQFEEMDIAAESKKAMEALFSDVEDEEEITRIAELPDIPEHIVEILNENKIELIEDLINLSPEEMAEIEGIDSKDVETITAIINDNVDIIEEEEENDETEDFFESEEDESYECPECGHPITVDMSTCPNCGVGLSFEISEEEE